MRGGFTHGRITIAPLASDESEGAAAVSALEREGSKLQIPFQNENLCADLIMNDGSRKVSETLMERTFLILTNFLSLTKSTMLYLYSQMLATVPDLITVLDSTRGSALGTQDYRYGLRVTVLALAGSPQWTKSERALQLGGPTAFG